MTETTQQTCMYIVHGQGGVSKIHAGGVNNGGELLRYIQRRRSRSVHTKLFIESVTCSDN